MLRKNDHAVERMIGSIREYGLKIPVLVTGGGEVIDGHLRLKAAKAMQLETVPVIRCDDWTAEQVRGFRLLANRSATWAEWDLESVAKEIAELNLGGFDLALTGFEGPEIDKLLFGDTNESEPELLTVPEEPISQPGDCWRLGAHRVLCGDSTDSAQVRRLLGGNVPVLMVTDPPYGVEYDPQWREQAGLGAQRQVGRVANDDRVDWSAAFEHFPGDVAYVWHAGLFAGEVAASLQGCGFAIRSQIVWAKQHFAMSRGHYHWRHEPCWYAVRQGRSGRWCGGRTESTVWEVANLNPFGGETGTDAVTGHGTQKPVELMRRPIVNHTVRGEAVYDPFLGSGTTLIAAEETGRVCLGTELDPRYVDVIVQRWEKRTGNQALLAEDGQTFGQIRGERRAKTEKAEEVLIDATA